MAVGSTFDQWQKDVFFTAAEGVQESADTMESLYRMWKRDKDELELEDSNGLLRELQTALGTAKWQLEEFERAVRFSNHRYSSEENTTTTRHRDFIAAISDQILRIEKEINDSLCRRGKQPLRWVQLDEEERDDLAAFLSGVSRNGPHRKYKTSDSNASSQVIADTDRECTRGYREKIVRDEKCVVKVTEKESHRMKGKAVCTEVEQQNGKRRGELSSPDNTGYWKIDIPDEEDPDENLAVARPEKPSHESATSGLQRVGEPATYLNRFRISFRKVKNGGLLQARCQLLKYLYLNGVLRSVKAINQLTSRSRCYFTSYKDTPTPSRTRQLVRRVGGFQNHLHGSQHCTQFARSMRLTLLLVLTIVFVAPFVLYAT